LKKKLFMYVTQHIDLVWRRCFERDFVYKNQNFVSYADLFENYIIENIKFCEKYSFYNFTVECVAVLEKFLERKPEYREKIKELFEKKQIYVPFSGNNIIDVNLVNGESIIRNYLYGYEYLKNNFNHIPYGIERLDAFGNSAQMPQIAIGFGNKWIYHVGYSKCEGIYWKGLDGSTVVQLDPDTIQFVGGWYKYRPCPACNGFKDKDCEVCGNKRIDIEYTESFRSHIYDPEITDDGMPKRIQCGGEEIIPSEEPIIWSLENKDKYDILFTNTQTYLPYIEKLIDNIDSAEEKDFHPLCEVNANNTGCYVTRIKLKQTARKTENMMLGAETLCSAKFVETKKYPHKEMNSIWSKVLFTDFHDAITGTIINAGYDELMDCFGLIEKEIAGIKEQTGLIIKKVNKDTLTVYNPYGSKVTTDVTITFDTKEDISLTDENKQAVSISKYEKTEDSVTITFLAEEISPFECKRYNVINKEYKKDIIELYKAGRTQIRAVLNNELFEDLKKSNDIYVIENEYFKVSATENGITEIFDKKLGRAISQKSEYMVGEWILEHDEGSPWATLSEDMRRQNLSVYTTLTKIEKSEDTQKFIFSIIPQDVEAYSVLGFRMLYSVTLQRNCDLVKFDADVFWHTQNYRLRIAVPAIGEGRHFYDIPYGVIERKPYKPDIVYPNGSSNIASAAGDYPAGKPRLQLTP